MPKIFQIPKDNVEKGDKKLFCTFNFDADEVIVTAVPFESDEQLIIAGKFSISVKQKIKMSAVFSVSKLL